MAYDSIYDAVSDLYDPDAAWEEIVRTGSDEHLNVAEEAIGWKSNSPDTALRLRDFETETTEKYTFKELNAGANRFANFLDEHTEPHHRIGAMLPPSFELYAVIFGTIKSGRIYIPLSPLFGPDALNYRLKDSGATVLVTDDKNVEKVTEGERSKLEYIVTTDERNKPITDIQSLPYNAVEDYGTTFETVKTHPRDTYTIKYTSGTTGHPKGCESNHLEYLASHAFLEHVVDLQPEDNYFVAASPAWSYGMRIGTISPGVYDTAIGCYRGKFDVEKLLDTLEEFQITNVMVPPTGLRQLQSADLNIDAYDINLRNLISAGEALTNETVEWCEEHLGVVPIDAYGFTEGGKMLICNYNFPDWEVKPGSMGKPMPGTEIRLIDEEGKKIATTGEVGEIVVKRTGPYKNYWNKPDKSLQMFRGQWLRTGDLASRDTDGYYWFASRRDDLIMTAGYRVGPDEVEATLLKHESVSEAAVFGTPDKTRGEIVKAVITLASDQTATGELKEDIKSFTRTELSKHEYPREIEIVDSLPKTTSGKIKKEELK